MKKLIRIFRHLTATRWQVMRRLPSRSMSAIESAIATSETQHLGELRFVVEAGLDWPDLLTGTSSRKRALEIFSQLRIWDTEHNSGVLIYLLLADNKVEILADRGINARVNQHEWISICQDMESKFRIGDFESGALIGIIAISNLLKQHFPAHGKNQNELADRPIIL
jgi:uncharacterized membrane protein